jgi:SAM-dependent methyltransferase
MPGPLAAALDDPWNAARTVLDGPLHPGGAAATERLLDRAGIEAGTRVLDVGCGSGGAVATARARGATAVGLDRDPVDGGLRGDMERLPVRDDAVDVVVAECSVCLAEDLDRALAETRRVLAEDGRLALSDVVTTAAAPELPAALARPLCLDGRLDREALARRVEATGFDVRGLRDHREELLATRDRVQERVDYEGLLSLLGTRGEELLEGVRAAETAVENGHVGYVSLVADTV